jgi:tyrosyl-tRNA synthetase
MPDADVIKLMRMLTMIEMEEIRKWEKAMKESGYVPNSAQKRLAEELVTLLHGPEALASAQRATEAVAPGHQTELSVEVFRQMMKDLPFVELSKSDVIDKKYADIAVLCGLVVSKGEATRLVAQGGAYLNNDRVEDPQLKFNDSHLIGGEFMLFAAGKKKKILIYLPK